MNSPTPKKAACMPVATTTHEITGVHSAAEMFPLVTSGPAFDALVEDIEAHGQRDPTLLNKQGLVIDGPVFADELRDAENAAIERRWEEEEEEWFVAAFEEEGGRCNDAIRARELFDKSLRDDPLRLASILEEDEDLQRVKARIAVELGNALHAMLDVSSTAEEKRDRLEKLMDDDPGILSSLILYYFVCTRPNIDAR